MKPFKKILVPVDFSAHSAEAVRYAADLSRRCEASVELLHVFQTMAYALPEGYVVPSGSQLQAILNEFESQLAADKRAAEEAGALNVATKLLQGGVATEILRCAKEHECDLLVMGTHGRTGMKHVLLGSVAEYLVRVAPCPVLTVRAPARATA
jgi:nucleotide-binding universal stress UspA family protein